MVREGLWHLACSVIGDCKAAFSKSRTRCLSSGAKSGGAQGEQGVEGVVGAAMEVVDTGSCFELLLGMVTLSRRTEAPHGGVHL